MQISMSVQSQWEVHTGHSVQSTHSVTTQMDLIPVNVRVVSVDLITQWHVKVYSALVYCKLANCLIIHHCNVTDINECIDGTANCSIANSHCINTEGGYQCICDLGFMQSRESTCTGISHKVCLIQPTFDVDSDRCGSIHSSLGGKYST